MNRSIHWLITFAFFFPAGVRSLSADEGLPQARSALTLLQINDVYSALPVDGGNTGGLARVATLKKQIAGEGRTVELLLCGDFLSPSIASSVFKGRQMMEAFDRAGVDLAILGNHEFDFGPDILRQRMSEAKWTWLVSNIFDEKTGRALGDYPTLLVKDYGGMKVGYFGLCLGGDEISADRRVGIRIDDPLATGERLVAELEKQGAEVIIALTHLDYADDRRLALRCPAIDLILGGHEHEASTTWVGRTLISKADSDARTVARIDLLPGEEGEKPEIQFELVPINASLADDPATALIARDYEDRLGMALEVEVGLCRTPLDAVAESVRSGESNLGNLLTDAMREDTGTAIAILNGGSIRSNQVFRPGTLRMKDLIAIHPFGGTVCVVEGPGALIIEMLNHGVGRLGESVGRFPQVSGISFRVDPGAPAGDRVREVKVGGEPIDPAKVYTFAVGDYMLKGGDGYGMLASAKVIINAESGNTLPDVLESYIRKRGEVAPEIEGRIQFAGDDAPVLTKLPVILDTDMGIDSVMGLLYLLREPTVDLKAVTISHGTADVDQGAANCLRVLELTGNRAIPVAKGPNVPLQGQRAFPDFWKEQANTLGETRLPEAKAELSSLSAAEMLVKAIRESSSPVTIVAMGPFTNLALALEKDPSIASKIREIVAMGGAVNGPGNIDKPYVGIRNGVAEWNLYLDPQAADAVLRSGIKVRLIPVEATRLLPVTPAFRDKVREAKRDMTSELLLGLLDAVEEGIDGGWFFFWDTMAAVSAIHPEVMGSHEETISVVLEEGPTLGQTLKNPGGISVIVGEEVNMETFETEFLETILD